MGQLVEVRVLSTAPSNRPHHQKPKDWKSFIFSARVPRLFRECGNRLFAGCSLQLRHCAFRQSGSVRCTGVQRGHPAALPAKDCFQLGDGSAVVCYAGRADLAHTMRGLCHACCVAGFTKQTAKGLHCERATILATDKSQVAAGASLKNFVKCRKNRNGDSNTSLFSANRRDAIADMLMPEAHRIAAAQAAVGQDTKPNALCGPYRPTRFVPLDIVAPSLPPADTCRQHAPERRSLARGVLQSLAPRGRAQRRGLAGSRPNPGVRPAHGVHQLRHHRRRRPAELARAGAAAKPHRHTMAKVVQQSPKAGAADALGYLRRSP